MDKRTSKRKAWKASCSYRYWRGPLNHRIVNFPFNCCAFSLLELTICIETAFYWNERYIMLLFDLRNFDLFARKIVNVWGYHTSLDWQVKTTYSWCCLSGRKSIFKTSLTGVPSLTSPPPSLLFFRTLFYFAPLPTIWTPGTGYFAHKHCTFIGFVVFFKNLQIRVAYGKVSFTKIEH